MSLFSKIRRKLGFREKYQSETSKVRHLVLPYCTGYGCDIGFGGDKVKKENCIGIDLPQPYAFTGNDPVDIPCNVMEEPIPVPDNTFDYVYSSHLIEDFEDTGKALREFIRILKPGGNLILVFPDQPAYEAYCRSSGQPLNTHHIHQDMGLSFMKNVMNQLQGVNYDVLFESDCEIDYNVVIVAKIQK